MLQMLNSFEKYDRDFEYGVELPSLLVRFVLFTIPILWLFGCS